MTMATNTLHPGSNHEPGIAVMPYYVKPGLFPGRVALDDLLWLRGRPDRLSGANKTLQDLSKDDHLLVFTSDRLHYRPWMGTRAKVSVMVLEPEAIHGKHMRWLKLTHGRFHKVLSCNETFLARIPNGIPFPLGGTWVGGWDKRAHPKTKACSLIASGKRALEGHALRHKTVEWVRAEGLDVEVMGKGYQPFDQKIDGLSPYRFSVVIENAKERNYFTEKLVDAVLCQTVPIYWGCPNLADFMDISGMIICNSEAEIKTALGDLSEARYASLLPGLRKAEADAASFGDIYDRAVQAVLDAPS